MYSALSANWRVVTIGDVADVEKGTSFTSKQLIPGGVPVIAGGRQPAYFHKHSNRPANTITVSASGDAGYVAFHRKPIFATDCTTIRSNSKLAITGYIYHYLKYNQNQLYRLRTGSALPHLYPKDLSRFKIVIPPLNQQQKIADILDDVDGAIERTEDVIVRTEQLEASLLDKVLTRGLPGHHAEWKEVLGLGVIPANWPVLKLQDIATVNRGISWSRAQEVSSYLADTIPVIRIGNVQRHGFDLENMLYLQGVNDKQKSQNSVMPDTIIMVGSNGNRDRIGNLYLANEQILGHLIASFLIVITPKQSISEKFLYLFLNSATVQSSITGSTAGSTGLKNLRINWLRSLPVPLPTLFEQELIAGYWDTINKVLNQLKQELACLTELKQSLTNKLISKQLTNRS